MSGAGPPVRRHTAPLARLVRSELALVVHRPRTAITLGTLVLAALLITFGLHSLGDPRPTTVDAIVVTASEVLAPVLAVPVLLVAADAFAAERALRTLDQLLIAPVGAGRLVLLKATGVVAVAALAAAVTIGAGLLGGLPLLGLGPYSFGGTLQRTVMIGLWLAVQLAGYGILLLPLSLLTRRTASVVAVGLAPFVLVLPVLPAWLRAVAPSGRWGEATTALSRVPADTAALGATTVRAVLYALIGAAVTGWLLTSRRGS